MPKVTAIPQTGEGIAMNDYMIPQTKLPTYLPFPRFLLTMDVTFTAKIIYTLLLDRTTLSQKNDWVDTSGHIYVVFTIQNLAQTIGRSMTATKHALNELQKAELIERKRHLFSAPSHIFVKLPMQGQKTDPMMDGKQPLYGTENNPSYSPKTDLMMGRKLSPNNLSNNNIRNNHLKGARKHSPLYGRYNNVQLTDADIAALQEELPNQWEQYAEQLSEYMASSGKQYDNHLATIRRWAKADQTKTKSSIPNYTYQEGESL